MKRNDRMLVGLALAGLFSFALAQPGTVEGIPDQYAPMVYGAISVIAGLLVEPLTAMLKRAGGTQGVTTVGISAVLSFVVAFGFTYAQALTTHQGMSWWATFGVAFWAFLQANGSYISKMLAAKRGTEKAGQDVSMQAAQEKANQPDTPLPSGLEEVPLDSTQGLLGFSQGGANFVQGMLTDDTLAGVIKAALKVAGIEVNDERVLLVGLRVLKLAPDLLDGDLHLSSENRGLVLNAVLDLKDGKVL